MQDGRTIYYSGNTINRGISKQSIRKRIDQTVGITPMNVQIPFFGKVFATHQCIWCNRAFEQYQIVCQYCHNCQYCGMVATAANQCHICGNHEDDELKQEREPRKTIIF